jgi:hypothetical protein
MTTNVRMTPGDLDAMAHAVAPHMPDKYDLYRAPGTTGKFPTTPKYTNQPCALQIVPRAVGRVGLEGDAPAAPTRFSLRTPIWADVRARDRVMVTNARTGEISLHTVQYFEGPHSNSIWQIFDLEAVQ